MAKKPDQPEPDDSHREPGELRIKVGRWAVVLTPLGMGVIVIGLLWSILDGLLHY